MFDKFWLIKISTIIYELSFPVTPVTYNSFVGLSRYNAGKKLCLFACLRFNATVYPHKYQGHCTCKMVIVVSVIVSIIILISFAVHGILYVVSEYNCAVHTHQHILNFIVPTSVLISLHFLKLQALRRSPALNSNSSLKMNVILSILMSIFVMSSGFILIYRILHCHVISLFMTRMVFIHIIQLSLYCFCSTVPLILFYIFSHPRQS